MATQSPLKGSSGRSGWIAPLIVLPLVVGLVFAAHSWVKSREKRVAGAELHAPVQQERSEREKSETTSVARHLEESEKPESDSYEAPPREVAEGRGFWAWFKGLFSSDDSRKNSFAGRRNMDDLEESRSTHTEENTTRKLENDHSRTVVIPVAQSEDCPAYEINGLGPDRERVKRDEWKAFMTVYHEVKADLLKWVSLQKGKWTDEQVERVTTLVKNQKIQRPPTYEEPDLSWRGVSVLTQDHQENPLLRVGGGFVRLTQTDLRRARFELTRLLTQVALPCELKAQKVESPWGALSSCFGVTEEPKCEPGTFSDLGWAISTSVAVEVSPPGCRIPALAEAKTGECVRTALAFPVATAKRSVASQDESANSSGKTEVH